ncbi:hypothetical protein BJX61DRAFT_543895 [Aspergillus egyptiacus]|nr:hypothetical protein BJX61DRAFT_543895 [Aspergillus egyptiacus]
MPTLQPQQPQKHTHKQTSTSTSTYMYMYILVHHHRRRHRHLNSAPSTPQKWTIVLAPPNPEKSTLCTFIHVTRDPEARPSSCSSRLVRQTLNRHVEWASCHRACSFPVSGEIALVTAIFDAVNQDENENENLDGDEGRWDEGRWDKRLFKELVRWGWLRRAEAGALSREIWRHVGAGAGAGFDRGHDDVSSDWDWHWESGVGFIRTGARAGVDYSEDSGFESDDEYESGFESDSDSGSGSEGARGTGFVRNFRPDGAAAGGGETGRGILWTVTESGFEPLRAR